MKAAKGSQVQQRANRQRPQGAANDKQTKTAKGSKGHSVKIATGRHLEAAKCSKGQPVKIA